MKTIHMEITCSGKPISLSKLKTIQNICDQICKTEIGKVQFARILSKYVANTNSSCTLSNFENDYDLDMFIREIKNLI